MSEQIKQVQGERVEGAVVGVNSKEEFDNSMEQMSPEQEDEKSEKNENRDKREDVEDSWIKIQEWIGQGAKMNQKLLDLSVETIAGGLGNREATDILNKFAEINKELSQVIDDFDSTLTDLVYAKYDNNSDVAFFAGNAIRLRESLQRKVDSITESLEENDYHKCLDSHKDAFESIKEGYVEWGEFIKDEMKKDVDEILRLKERGNFEDEDKIVELVEDVQDLHDQVFRVFGMFASRLPVSLMRSRIHLLTVGNIKLSGLQGESFSIELSQFKQLDGEMEDYNDEYMDSVTQHRNNFEQIATHELKRLE